MLANIEEVLNIKKWKIESHNLKKILFVIFFCRITEIPTDKMNKILDAYL